MVDKKVDENESFALKKSYSHYLEKRNEMKRNSQFKGDDVFGDSLNIDSISSDQRTKPSFPQNDVSIKFCIKITLLKPWKEKNVILN